MAQGYRSIHQTPNAPKSPLGYRSVLRPPEIGKQGYLSIHRPKRTVGRQNDPGYRSVQPSPEKGKENVLLGYRSINQNQNQKNGPSPKSFVSVVKRVANLSVPRSQKKQSAKRSTKAEMVPERAQPENEVDYERVAVLQTVIGKGVKSCKAKSIVVGRPRKVLKGTQSSPIPTLMQLSSTAEVIPIDSEFDSLNAEERKALSRKFKQYGDRHDGKRNRNRRSGSRKSTPSGPDSISESSSRVRTCWARHRCAWILIIASLLFAAISAAVGITVYFLYFKSNAPTTKPTTKLFEKTPEDESIM